MQPRMMHCSSDFGLGMLYRVEARHYAPSLDEWDNPVGPGSAELVVWPYPIIKVTKCGKWISVYGEKRFILDKSHKRFACETVELAVEAFQARKRRQIAILQAQLARAQGDLAMASGSRPSELDLLARSVPLLSANPRDELRAIL